MSDVINLPDARLRGIDLPADDNVAQDILDEQESWLAHRIGPLTGDRTETFYVGFAETRDRLGLARYTDEVSIEDAGAAVDADHYRLVSGSVIIRRSAAPSRWWTGPYVEVTYEPNDLLDVQRVLYDLVAMVAKPDEGFESETLGDYSYSRGGGKSSIGSRAALASSLLPKRDPLVNVPARSRPLYPYDPIINRPEQPL